jgi:hypothetical protein
VGPAVVPFLRGHDAAIYLAVAGTLVRWLPMLHRPTRTAERIVEAVANGLRFTFSTPDTNAPLIIGEWLSDLAGKGGRYLFPSRIREQPNLSTRQYARIVHQWIDRTDLDSMLARRKNGA